MLLCAMVVADQKVEQRKKEDVGSNERKSNG